jgi:type I restriction enzyme, S subunit
MTLPADRKVPEIRFHKFEAAWRRYSLAEAANFRRGSFPQPYGLKEWYDGPDAMPFVQVIDVTKELSLAAKTKQRISKIAQFKSVFVEKGSVVVTLQGSIGRVAILPYDAYIDRTLLIFKEYTYKTNTHFWAYLIQKVFDTEKQRAPGGIIKTITKEALSKFQILTPVFEEQTQIGNYFQNLDSLINQHQHKHDTLLTLKIAMLQKMFPQAGAATPEIRFGGFEGDWEELEFKFIALRSSQSCSENHLPRIEYEDIVSGDGRLNKNLFKKVSQKAGIQFAKDDVLFGKLRPYLRNWWLAEFQGIAVGDFWVLTSATGAASFLYCLIQTEAFERIANQSAGSKMPRSDWKLVSNSLFRVPTDTLEQQKIGIYFRTLDELISKHAIQLQKLKQIKSACLEKMFV